jgi:hypothetical protein
MNPIKAITRPVKHLADAVLMPLKFVFVVGLTGLINWMTFSGTWWVKWVALGMGIAVLVAWGRALKTALVLGLLAWAGWTIYKRYGPAARERFDAWAQNANPGAAEVLDALRTPAAYATGGGARAH